MKDKIFIGIVTCERPAFLEKLVFSVSGMKNLFIISDSKCTSEELQKELDVAIKYNAKFHKTTGRISVGQSKNIIFTEFLRSNCEYLFIIEDDMYINDVTVFNDYITAYKNTGMHHMMYALHSPENKIARNTNRNIARWEYEIVFYPELCGSMCFYTREAVNKAGMMDPAYYNAMEHVDHTYVISKLGLTSPFRWFPDVATAEEKISEQAPVDVNSLLRKDPKYISIVREAIKYFETKHTKFSLLPRDTTQLVKYIDKHFRK